MAATTTMSEQPPIGVYDPNAKNPYTAPDSSSAGGPPPITAPPPSSITQKPDQPAPSVIPNKGGKAAGIAYLLDSVLKGAMKGREQKQQQQAAKANKLIQGM